MIDPLTIVIDYNGGYAAFNEEARFLPDEIFSNDVSCEEFYSKIHPDGSHENYISNCNAEVLKIGRGTSLEEAYQNLIALL